MNKSDYCLLTKQARTWRASRGIVLQVTSGKWAEIAHGMTLHHPYYWAGFPLCVYMLPFSCAPNTWWDSWQVWSRVQVRSRWNFAGIF
jgi:hypothetical protein